MSGIKASTLKKWSQTFAALCLLSALTACGGESGADSSGSQHWPENQAGKYVSVYAEDFYKVVQSDALQEVRVDFDEKIMRSGGEPVVVTDIEVFSSDPSCRPFSRDKAGFNIIPDGVMVCDYQYTVGLDENSNKQQLIGKRSGISRVVVSKSAKQVELVPFGVAAYQGETLVIKIKQQLAAVGDSNSLSGYKLTGEYVLMPDPSSSQITLDEINNTISYTPAITFEGSERILYTLKNSSGDVLAGSVMVTVSEKSTQGINIQEQIAISAPVGVGQELSINLSDYVDNNISFQLIQVVSFDSIVALKNKIDPENTSFTFRAAHPGDYYVSAVVTDHKGGFDAALIRISVSSSPVSLWGNYYHKGYVFSAPLTEHQANNANIDHDGFVIDSVHPSKLAVAVFKNNNARNYCSSKGSLPTPELLKSVWQSDEQNQKNWPLSRGYLARKADGSYVVVSLSNGQVLTSDGQGYYVTCMKKVGYVLQAKDVQLKGNMIFEMVSDTNVIGTEIFVPNTIAGVEIKAIGGRSFANTSQYGKDLSSLVIEEGITSIGYFTFANNDLKNLILPNSLTTIGEGAFVHNELTKLNIPKGVKTIGLGAFAANKLSEVTFHEGLEFIDQYAFNVNKLKDITIPASVKRLARGAFQKNQLVNVEMKEGLNTIGEGAFWDNKLAVLSIPQSVTTVDKGAFNNNELVSVSLSGAIKRVDAAIFSANETIRKVTLVGESIIGRDLKRMFSPARWPIYHRDGTIVEDNDTIEVGETVYFELEYIE